MNQLIAKLVNIHKTRDPMRIAENLGIIILYENLGTINGFFNTVFRQKFIHINENLSTHSQYFTAAHELGHALLHPKANTPFLKEKTYLSVDKLEIEANRFAMNLLISDEDIAELQNFTVEQFSLSLGYHKKLIQLRLNSRKQGGDL